MTSSLAIPQAQNIGLVTSLEEPDLPTIRKAMHTDAHPIKSAGILPPHNILLRFATHFPVDTPFSYILLRLHEISLKHPRFHICDLRDQIVIADMIEPVKRLTTHDRIVFCAAPVSSRVLGMPEVAVALAECVGNNRSGALLDLPEIEVDILDVPISAERAYLAKLESVHTALILYLWLSYRYDGVFPSQPMAFHVKKLVEEKIDTVLAQFSDVHHMLRLREQKTLRNSRAEAGDFETVETDKLTGIIPVDTESREPFTTYGTPHLLSQLPNTPCGETSVTSVA